MSRTKHHRGYHHLGHDYGGRYRCNRGYGNSYGVDGRNLADKERRQDDKRLSLEGINQVDDMPNVCEYSHTGDNMHSEGACPDCDYTRYVDWSESKDIDIHDPRFIEAWEWPEWWDRNRSRQQETQ